MHQHCLLNVHPHSALRITLGEFLPHLTTESRQVHRLQVQRCTRQL